MLQAYIFNCGSNAIKQVQRARKYLLENERKTIKESKYMLK